jgi:two-component sensor histidine kinase
VLISEVTRLKNRKHQIFPGALELDEGCPKPSRGAFLGLVLFMIGIKVLAQSTADQVPIANAHASASVVENNPLNLKTNLQDSLTERGSYNFSDMGSWIWGAKTMDRQTCRFWKSFEIPEGAKVARARLRITGDNEYTLFLDGRELGRDAEWRHLYEYDITALLSPGRHILAVDDYNSFKEAGMILGLQIGLVDGRKISVKSDQSWVVGCDGVPGWENVSDWQKMSAPPPSWPASTIIAACGSGPWAVSPWFIEIVPPLNRNVIPFWQTGWFQITVLAVLVVLALVTLWVVTQLALRTQEQRLLHQERARIARDIHDDLGMRMTQLVLQGEVAVSEVPPQSGLHSQLSQLCEDAREALRAMDEVLWAINPRRDNLREFTTYVCRYAQTFLKDAAIQCTLDVEPEMYPAAFNLPLRRNLLMAVKEALHNAAKHSHASELILRIRCQGQALHVVVQDNGWGFDPRLASPDRNGLTNMSQRMNELGGRCHVNSQPGQGCRVEMFMPLVNSRRSLLRPDWFQILSTLMTKKSNQPPLAVSKETPIYHDQANQTLRQEPVEDRAD